MAEAIIHGWQAHAAMMPSDTHVPSEITLTPALSYALISPHLQHKADMQTAQLSGAEGILRSQRMGKWKRSPLTNSIS